MSPAFRGRLFRLRLCPQHRHIRNGPAPFGFAEIVWGNSLQRPPALEYCRTKGRHCPHTQSCVLSRSPRQPSAAVIVGALEDAYVTRQSVEELAAHWPGSEVRWVPGGHVSAFLLQQPAFRTAITDSLSRLQPDDGGPRNRQ